MSKHIQIGMPVFYDPAETGPQPSADSIPVVIAPDQSPIPVTQSGTWNINDISGTISLPTGAATSAKQTTGNASLASIDGKLNSLGQKDMAGSVPVTMASDQTPISVFTNATSTYGAAVALLPYAANGTDIFTITGSDTKVIRIKHISIDGTQTASAVRSVLLIKRSSPNSGGTFSTLTAVPYDSANPAATAVVRAYTANPTVLGTAVGTLHAEKLILSTATNPSVSDALVFSTIDVTNSQDITLRGSNEVLAINMNGVTSTGNSMDIDIMWTEE